MRRFIDSFNGPFCSFKLSFATSGMQISYYFLVQPKDKRKIIRLGQSQSDRFQEQHTAATAVASVGILEKKKRKEKKMEKQRGKREGLPVVVFLPFFLSSISYIGLFLSKVPYAQVFAGGVWTA